MHIIPFESNSLQVYSFQQHASVRFHVHDRFDFAEQWLFLPIHRLEALKLYKQVPIVFYQDHQKNLSIAALLFDQTGHVIKSPKQCTLNYLPVAFRLYPFSWVDQDNRSHITIYTQAPHFQGSGEKLFTSKQKPTQRMRNILHHVGLARAEYQKTREFIAGLAKQVKFKPLVLNLTQGGESRKVGFLVIDPESINFTGLSNEQRDLVVAHTRSLEILEKTNASTTQTNQPLSNQQRASGPLTADQLIDQVCQEYSVTLDDLLSRKRGDALIQARRALVQLAEPYAGMLEKLAQKLDRTVSTLKRWGA